MLAGLNQSTNIPGLDIKSVAEGMVNNNPDYQEALNDCSSDEEREEMKKGFVDYYLDKGKVEIESNISIIKASAEAIKNGVPQTAKAITEITASLLVPTAAAAALPQVPQVKCNVDNLKNLCVTMITASLAISFILPDSILALVTGVMNLYTLISKIPI